MINESNQNFESIVICSSPVDDNIPAEKYNAVRRNIVEFNVDLLSKELKLYNNVMLVHNGDDEDARRLYIFAKQNKLEVTFELPQTLFHSDHQTNIINNNDMLFVGCSHTHGEGHSSLESVFPHLLSKKLNLNSILDAHPGKGNYLTEEKINQYDLKNKKVIIQMTDIYRLHLNGISIAAKDYTRDLNSVYTEEVLSSNYCALFRRLVNYLRAQESQFLIFQLSMEYPYYESVSAYCSDFNEFVHMEDYNVDVGDLGHHFGIKSHNIIANKLYNKWIEIYGKSEI